MRLFRNPELKGKVGLIVGVLLLGLIFMALTGKFEQWFGITWFSGQPVTGKIAFLSDVDGSAEVCLMGTDGSDRVQLTTGARASGVPAVSPSGTKIAFVATFGTAGDQIYTVGSKPGSKTQITTATGPKARPAYLHKANRLSYISSGRVFTSELDGGAVATVLPTSKQIQMAMYSSSSIPGFKDYVWDAGEKSILAISRTDTDAENLVFQPSEDADVVPMLPPNAPQTMVQAIASARGKALYAAVIGIGKERLVLALDPTEPDIKPRILLKLAGDNVTSIAFSDDGSKFAMALQPAKGKPVLVFADLSAGQPPVALAPGVFDSLSFSPSGDQLLATQIVGDKKDIVVVDLTSREVRPLTADGASYNAIWTDGPSN